MKKCPYCSEEIQDDAKKCKHCGEYLNKKKKWLNCLVGCLVVFGVLNIFFIFFVFFFAALLKAAILKLFFFGPFFFPHPPYSGQGIEGFFRDFAEVLRQMLDKLMEIFRLGPQSHMYTF